MDLNCRVCLQVSSIMLSLFEEIDQYQMNLGELLESCSDLKVDKNDCFPKYLCQQCTQELITVADFQKKCKKSKDIFESMCYDTELVQGESVSKKTTECKENLRDFIIEENSTLTPLAEDCDSNSNDLSREIMELEKELLGAEQMEVSFSDIKAETEPYIVIRQTNFDKLTCEMCNISFCTRTELNIHMQKHPNFRPYNCNVCQKRFKRKETLQAHMRLHTGERPYKCDFCCSTFVQRCDLAYHKVAIHTDERRFKCPICPKTFMKRTYLERHKMTHAKKRSSSTHQHY